MIPYCPDRSQALTRFQVDRERINRRQYRGVSGCRKVSKMGQRTGCFKRLQPQLRAEQPTSRTQKQRVNTKEAGNVCSRASRGEVQQRSLSEPQQLQACDTNAA